MLSRYANAHRSPVTDALLRIEHRAKALLHDTTAEALRAERAGAPVYARVVQALFDLDVQTLRAAWLVVARQPERDGIRSPLIDVSDFAPHPSMQQRTIDERLHVLDVLRENHVLALGEDDLQVAWRGDQLQPYDAADEADVDIRTPLIERGDLGRMLTRRRQVGRREVYHAITADGDGHHYLRERVDDHDAEVVTSGEQERSWEEACFVSRKRRTHRVPADLEVGLDPLMHPEVAAAEAAHEQTVSDLLWELVERGAPCELGYRWDEEGVLDLTLVAELAPDAVLAGVAADAVLCDAPDVRVDVGEARELVAQARIPRSARPLGWR